MLSEEKVKERTRVSEHYSNRRDRTLGERIRPDTDPCHYLKNFNNWCKYVLLRRWMPRRGGRESLRVLDMCCGKGGDWHKYVDMGVTHVIGIDSAKGSIEDAQSRHRSIREKRRCFDLQTHVADCFQIKGFPVLTKYVDLVACQFALHYAFQSQETLHALLGHVDAALPPHEGIFLGILIDADVVSKELMRTKSSELSNSICKLSFDEIEGEGEGEDPQFGMAYKFSLVGSVDKCTEYLPFFDTLVTEAKAFRLKLVESRNLQALYHDAKGEFHDQLKRYHVFQPDGSTLSDDEWYTAGLYRTFVFTRT